ncbi:MAG: hypothetical protein V4592_04940 [Bacteroidota bacterium]
MEENQAHQDLASIRNLMERSSKFLSLSGLSGVLAGIYALVGAALAYRIIYNESMIYQSRQYYSLQLNHPQELIELMVIAVVVLGASLLTGFILSLRKARRTGQKFWGASSKALVFNMAIPLLTGGAMMLIFLLRGYFGIIAPASLIFYGLALVAAGNYTLKGVQYLGINEIVLGLVAALLPGYGLLFWAIGFGVLHIIYGSVMYFKYDK